MTNNATREGGREILPLSLPLFGFLPPSKWHPQSEAPVIPKSMQKGTEERKGLRADGPWTSTEQKEKGEEEPVSNHEKR